MDFFIERCTVRVVRRGGWSWGPDPARLLEAVKRALPGLIARQLEAGFPEGADLDLRQPLRVSVRAKLADLLALQTGAERSAPGDARLPQRLEAALGDALAPLIARPVEVEVLPAKEPGSLPVPKRSAEPPFEPAWSARIFRSLSQWRAAGVLPAMLRLFSLRALESWHAALLSEPPAPSNPRVAAEGLVEFAFRKGELQSVLLRLRSQIGANPARAEALRARLLAIGESGQLGFIVVTSELRATIEEVLPLPIVVAVAEDPRRGDVPGPVGETAGADPIAPRGASVAAVPGAIRQLAAPLGEVHVRCALPFLLAGPLAQAGWIDALPAVLGADQPRGAVQLAAAALAYKVLDAPERGWRRSPESRADAAAFAGLAEPAPEPALVDLAHRCEGLLSPLDAVLLQAAAARRTGDSFLLLRDPASGHLVLFEQESLCAVAGAAKWPALHPALSLLPGVLLLLPSASADPVLLRALDQSGLTFVTDAPPARGERWRPLGRAPHRLFTNDRRRRSADALFAAEALGDRAELALAAWRAVTSERLAAPLAPAGDLERSLGLAASAALGAVAFRLFGERETPHPGLALLRFRDLGATVRFEERSVQVRLPLGRRMFDLLERGLLGDVAQVPWLGGRALHFSGG
jgi:hypothetical protein